MCLAKVVKHGLRHVGTRIELLLLKPLVRSAAIPLFIIVLVNTISSLFIVLFLFFSLLLLIIVIIIPLPLAPPMAQVSAGKRSSK
jgi:hypothetical protein